MNLFSYILRYDDGAAPNPYYGYCTLAICKPVIRRNAKVGDWVVGLGSSSVLMEDGNNHNFSKHIIYAMRVSEKMTIKEYGEFCLDYLNGKIPNINDLYFPKRVGDCIYYYSKKKSEVILRDSVHTEVNRKSDLGGEYVLLADEFYYFGSKPQYIPEKLHGIIHQNQGHQKQKNDSYIEDFIEWISKFKKNNLYAEPQLKYEFKNYEKRLGKCSVRDLLENQIEDNFLVTEE